MESLYNVIFDTLATLLGTAYPDCDIYGDEIVQGGGQSYFWIDLMPVGSTTLGSGSTQHKVLVDISAHLKSEAKTEYLSLAQQLDGLLRPVLRFRGRVVTIPETAFQIVDKVLHCSFTLSFTDGTAKPIDIPLMEELETEIM